VFLCSPCILSNLTTKATTYSLGYLFLRQAPLPKSLQPLRVPFPTGTGTHLPPAVFKMAVAHLTSLPSNTESRGAQGKMVAEWGASAIFQPQPRFAMRAALLKQPQHTFLVSTPPVCTSFNFLTSFTPAQNVTKQYATSKAF